MRCRCGKVQGDVEPGRAYARGTCYCRDCQAYARFLAQPGLMDEHGGSDVVPVAPSGVRITAGLDQVDCVSLSEKGLYRWYAACCRTPLANTPRAASFPYVGMSSVAFEASSPALDAALGPRDRVVFNTGSAKGTVRSTPLAFLVAGMRIFGGVLAARLRREPPALFFDAEGRPIRQPQVLDAEQRATLGANSA
jgi:hypothetical protein